METTSENNGVEKASAVAHGQSEDCAAKEAGMYFVFLALYCLFFVHKGFACLIKQFANK